MKKLTLGLLFIIVLASCKKNYECACDYYMNGSLQTSDVRTFKNTKAKAESSCNGLNNSGNFVSGGMNIETETKCTLK